MFDLFSDAAKVAQQMEIISSEYGFALWETLYSLALEVLFAYMVGLPPVSYTHLRAHET